MAGIVIVGAGECGLRAAFAARNAGYAGEITVIGAETTLPYERPPLSKPDAAGVIEKPITSKEALSACAIALRSGVTVTEIDRANRQLQLSVGSALGYDKLLLTTGARPRTLACPGGEHARVFRTIEDAREVFRSAGASTRVTIVGAGLIGLELAAVLIGRCAKVTVLEAGPRPLGRNVPEPFAMRLAERHRQRGVDIRCGVALRVCTAFSVVLENGQTIDTDLAVAAIGVTPNIDLAEAAGLTTQNGICVDAGLRTEDPRIFAAGDCAAVQAPDGGYRHYETWQNAQAQRDVAGANLAGGDARFSGPVWFWSDQYDLGLQGFGETEGDPAAIRDLGNGAEVRFYSNDAGQLIGAAGLGPSNAVSRDIKIAQRLAGATLDPALLADANQNMKKLLRAA
ncbi:MULTISPECIES: NAD(P)/FAD-dependent oxidoreductase [Marinovum]|uniref:3-phenylpropionate/trans-cinnamate dioxygenase ferredoxin reductase subunit n=1 Tax=Marinovum algicola TaxID=42444 RepID=A0A975WCI3_9RHOB|nr:FAD-dependent oxidoreductase [Marinovum algicola]SEJ91186.1 3-phenylpropionate/trans-cinnamate dioxygenase ferredoxin reductase subunit [Marinovum algicola]SLN42070.1 Putidaredoxin reductase [Marinovum algicola]